jgi:hypothetical protein
MKRHKLLVLLGLLLPVALMLPSGTAAQSTAAGSLTIAAVQGVEDAGLKALAPMYTAATGVQINIVEAPYADLYTKLVNAFSANDATYDLVMMDDPWMPKFGTMGALSDLGALGITQDPDIAQVVWDVGTWPPPRGATPPSEVGKPSQLLGVTIVGNVEMFMYRSDITPTPPASYDDVLANATAQNKSDFAGYIIRGKATNPVVADFLPILCRLAATCSTRTGTSCSIARSRWLRSSSWSTSSSRWRRPTRPTRTPEIATGSWPSARASSRRSGRARSTRPCSGRARPSLARWPSSRSRPDRPARAWA